MSALSRAPFWQTNLERQTGSTVANPGNPVGPMELSPEELDAMASQYTIPEAERAAEFMEFTPEDLDALAAEMQTEELDPVELDKIEAGLLHDPYFMPSREEWKRLRKLEQDLKSEGALPSGWGVAKEAIGGLLVTAKDALVHAVTSPLDTWSRLPATIQVGGSRMVVNTLELGQWATNAIQGTPKYRVEDTGEFIFASDEESEPNTAPNSSLADFQRQRPGQKIRPVTEDDLEDFEYERWIAAKGLKQVYEDLGAQQAPPELLYAALTGFQDMAPRSAVAPQSTLVEMGTDLVNLFSFGAGGIPTGVARTGVRLSAKSAEILRQAAGTSAAGVEKAADLFTSTIEKATGATRQTQANVAKWAAGGGAVGTVGAAVSGADLDPAMKTGIYSAMAFYPAYKLGLGTLRKVEAGAGSASVILREAADASQGLDQAARASIIANPEIPDVYRAVLADPKRYVSIESTPARLAQEMALSPQTRAYMQKLANPLIVQSVRATSAMAGGAVKGTLANAPFAALAENSGEEDLATAMLALGGTFGAAGGAASRFSKFRARREQAAAADVARMLVDVELNGGDAASLVKSMSHDQLVKLASMQGVFRGGMDFIPLKADEYSLNVQANGGTGTAGMFVQAPDGHRARVFINVDAKSGGVVPHEFGHALLASGALGGTQKASIRNMIQSRYGADGVEARGREYAVKMLESEYARAFPDQVRKPSETEIKAKLDELQEQGLARGDMDPLDWVRDEIFAEEFSKASDLMDFAAIRRNYGGTLAGFTEFAEGVLGAQARALSASGVRIDPETGRAIDTPKQLFESNPILGTDKVLLQNLETYISNYRKWLYNPDAIDRKSRGVPVMPRGSADVSALKDNPLVKFYDRGDGVMQNEFARIDPATGQAVLKDAKEIAAETKKRQIQIKSIIGTRIKGPQDKDLGPRRTSDGRTIVTGRTLPGNFDFLNGFAPHIREFARALERMGDSGESVLVRYHAIGTGDSGAFKVKNLGNLEAIQREVIPFGWQMSKNGNLLAQVIDLTSLRTKAIRAINNRSDALAPFNWDMREFDQGLKTWMNNHRNNIAGETGIGIDKRDAIDAMVGIGTKLNRSRNPLAGQFGPGSAIKSFRLDRVDAIMPTGRTGFFFDYDKANGNFMPETTKPIPDLSEPVRGIKEVEAPKIQGQAMPDLNFTD